MAGALDRAYGNRPAVPVNKKRKPHPAFNQPLAYAPGSYSPEVSRAAQESTRSARPPATALAPYDAETAERVGRSGFGGEGMPRSETEINRIADQIFAREQAESAYPATDAGIADFRARRSARDRMLGGNGLNIGRTGSGERVNPMMPGAAGMGTGPSNTNYGGQGAKTNWYIDQENVRNEVPNGTERMGRVMSENFYGGSGKVISQADALDIGQNSGASERINALKKISGLPGAAKAGFLDRYVSNESTLSKLDPQQRAEFAARREAEETRKADRLTTKGDDGLSISDKLKARGEAKAAERSQRMAGPTDEQRLMNMAASGNPAALRMLDMVAQGNRDTNVAGIDAASRREGYASNEKVAGIQFGQPAKLSPEDQYRADTVVWGEGGGEAVLGPFDEWRENGGLTGGVSNTGGGQLPKVPAWARDPQTGEPAMDQEDFLLRAKQEGMTDEEAQAIAATLPKKKPNWFKGLFNNIEWNKPHSGSAPVVTPGMPSSMPPGVPWRTH